MYRPLVQPFFANTRGQKISPGLTVLATGGPKHRGDLDLVNPNLLRDAEGWSGAVVPLYRFDGHVRVENDTRTGRASFIRQDALTPVVAGDVFRIRVKVDEFSGPGTLEASVGFDYVPIAPVIKAPSVYNIIYTATTPTSDAIIFSVADTSNTSVQVSFLGVYRLGVS